MVGRDDDEQGSDGGMMVVMGQRVKQGGHEKTI